MKWVKGLIILILITTSGKRVEGQEKVIPSLLCETQHAIRWRDRKWTPNECMSRAKEYTTTATKWHLDPQLLVGLSINESDLRTKALRVSHGAVDCGLMAVRCKLGNNGKCKNFPVRGFTPAQLLKPSLNIEKGAEILVTLHGGNLQSYNGSKNDKDYGYTNKIAVILVALRGGQIQYHHKKMFLLEKGKELLVKGVRLRDLVNKIVIAVRQEVRT